MRKQSPNFVTLLRPMSACQMIRNVPLMTEEMILGNSSTLGTLAPFGIPSSNLGPISNIFNSILGDASVCKVNPDIGVVPATIKGQCF